ncbi:uncharacterized protein LOC132797980 [Drosophila nasuta]|uniref:uncharacterized protein LOC132797980 n=1 Tax=Drosophila nasuta TaxID=42062 RepID=UPI00295E9464|nr:uncharacterized protein LOC132797980 [Drosophila nasuta]
MSTSLVESSAFSHCKPAQPNFIARRGVPLRIYSDNATNFVGTNNLLKELQMEFSKQQEKLQLFASEMGMEWHFIPPRAPHFGGLWEAAVKSAKHLLVRQMANASLAESEVRAHLADVEAILNSRPLTPLSSDPNDGEALTPGHLLIGQAIRSLPQGFVPDRPNKELTYLRRWQMLSTLRQRFWLAWSKDYIHKLQIRTKWKSPQPGGGRMPRPGSRGQHATSAVDNWKGRRRNPRNRRPNTGGRN